MSAHSLQAIILNIFNNAITSTPRPHCMEVAPHRLWVPLSLALPLLRYQFRTVCSCRLTYAKLMHGRQSVCVCVFAKFGSECVYARVEDNCVCLRAKQDNKLNGRFLE